MARLVLHAGLQRTGTSSLQARLLGPRGALAAAGIDPLAGAADPSGAHHNAAREARGGGRHDPDRPGLAALAAAVRGSPAAVAFASSEEFGILPPEGVARLAAALEGVAVAPVLVLRSPLDFAESLYAQACRDRPRPPFAEHLGMLEFGGRLAFDRVAERWEAAFGSVHLIAHEAHPDTAAAVAATMGVALAPGGPRRNASLNERYVLASQRVLRELAPEGGARGAALGALMRRAAAGEARFAGRPAFLSRAEAQALLDRWRPRAEALARRLAIPPGWTALDPGRREPARPGPAEAAEDEAILRAALAGA